jgi:8-oxo-dGTP diphosphatase/2-hydroxy-dATP diphosphatase
MGSKIRKKVFTICVVQRGKEALLGLKKRGFGVGRWNGFGGKVKEGEKVDDAARREVLEEIGITVNDLERFGVIEFRFRAKPNEILEAHIFRSHVFLGEPKESEEMKPQWFSTDEIPYEAMWAADRYWFPLLLAGRKFRANFFYDTPASDVIIEKTLSEVKEIDNEI